MKKLPVSVFIITLNEEERLPKALQSVIEWVDEVIVIDSGSTDKTKEIAESFGAKVIHNDWQGFGPQKIFGESKCRNKWILNIDADEEVSNKLKDKIFNLFDSGEPQYAAYKMYWKLVFFTQETPPSIAVGSDFIRLYNKQKAGFRDSSIHDSVILKQGFENEKIGEIKNAFIYHRSFKSMKHWADKINYYTTLQAEEWFEKGRKQPSTFRIIIEPIFSFVKAYFVRKYIFYGIDGFLGSLMYTHSKVLRLAKVREKFRLNRTNSH